MLQQNRNNFTYLDELASVPGKTIANKAALWQKLEIRLQKKPQQTKVVWYWAAACILVFVMFIFIFIDNKYKAGEAIVLNNNFSITKPLQQIKKTTTIENIQVKKTETKLPIVVNNFTLPNNKIQVSENKHDSFIAIAPPKLDNKSLVYSSIIVDTVERVVAIKAKKKLSVVHINELQEEDRIAEGNINIAKSFKKKRTKIADRSEYAGTLNFRIYFKN